MGMLRQMWKQAVERSREQRSGYEALDEVVLNLRADSATGVHVSTEGALRFSAVFAAVRILSETVASLPLIIYERLAHGRRRATDFYLYPLLHDAPNDLMTAFEFRETIQGHVSLWGNGYAEIEYGPDGRIHALWPLRPDRMLRSTIVDGRRMYEYQLPNGSTVWLSGDRVWHLRGLGGDGYTGYSPIGLHRRSVELGLAAQEFGARFFGNDARPGGVLEHPGRLSEEAHANLRQSWEEAHGGLSRSHRVAILEEGLKFHEIGIPPEDAQYLQTRRHQVEEIARIFRIPPHMLADLERSTFSNIEHQSLEFMKYTMLPWFERWQQSIAHNLMLAAERRRYYAEFLTEAMLRGDTLSRYQAYAQARQNGWLSANEIRRLENMDPAPGGDTYLVPLNMIPVSEPGAASAQPAARFSEERSMRSATARHRLRASYVTIYHDVAARILRREVHDITRQARKMLRTRDLPSFRAWLDEFYRDHTEYIMRQMRPVNNSYGEAAAGEAQEEVNEPVGMTEAIEKFLASYTGGYAARHVGISRDRLNQAMMRAQNDPALEPLDAVLDEVSTWEERRSSAIADEEATRLGAAVAKVVFIAAGFTKLRWVTFGDSCPYCNLLSGRVVGIQEHFLSAGESLAPEGADGPLTTTTNIGHPPAHTGCDCGITVAL